MKTDHADLLVIGASAAGLKCAARFRRLRPEARIIVLDAAREISVGACGLPYVVSGDIDSAKALRETAFHVKRDEKFFAGYKNIEVHAGVKVNTIVPASRMVHASVVDGNEEMSIEYGDLMIATGATPKRPKPWPEFGGRIRAVKSMDDAREIRASLEKGQLDSVAIIGAGFIGCEMAEAFGSMWGCKTILFEAADQVLPGMLDPDMAALVENGLRQHSVDVRTSTPIASIKQSEAITIEPQKGEPLKVDMVVVAIGVAPNVALAASAGAEIGKTGAIRVDEQMRTSLPHVYAAGDCVECVSAVDGSPRLFALGSLANRQGRVAADRMADHPSSFGPVAGSMIVKVFDLNAAATGMTERDAQKGGIDARCVWGTFGDRAHYYPDDQRVFAKMVYAKESHRLVGLQLVGEGNVTRLVDVFASLLLRGAKVEELHDQEFAYAPPFAAALDPLHHLGAMAMAWEQDGLEGVAPAEDLGDAIGLDVRLSTESEAFPCEDEVMQIPMGEVRRRADEIGEGDVVVICEKGPRSLEVARFLQARRNGTVRYLAGGRGFRQRIRSILTR